MLASEIISSVQGLLQDDQFSSSAILEAANWLVDELFNNNNLRIAEKSDVISASTGDVSLDYPDDMRTVEAMWMSINSQFVDLATRFIAYRDFLLRYPNYRTAPSTVFNEYTNFGHGIRFSAPLLDDIDINIDYLRNAVPMVDSNDVCEIPDQYKEIISRGTLARCMEQNEDYAEAANERNIIAPLITTFIRRESVGQIKTGPVVMRSGRRTTGWKK